MFRMLSFFLLLSMGAVAQTRNNNSVNNDWKTFEDSEYSIRYPLDWVLNQEGTMNTNFILFSPKESSNDQVSENVNLVVEEFKDENIDLAQFIEMSKTQLHQYFENATVSESNIIKGEMGDYYRIIFAGILYNTRFKFEQYAWVINNKGIILTFTAEEDKFDQYKELGEKILQSFKIKNYFK